MNRSTLTLTATTLTALLFAPGALAAPTSDDASVSESVDHVGVALRQAAEVATDEAAAEAEALADEAEDALADGADAAEDTARDAMVFTRSTLIQVAHSLPKPTVDVPTDTTPIEAVELAWDAVPE